MENIYDQNMLLLFCKEKTSLCRAQQKPFALGRDIYRHICDSITSVLLH